MMRRFFYRLLRLILLAALVMAIWAGWYVYRKGFTKKWRQFIATEFHKRGVEISFSRLTLDPVHGLVARDVVIVDNKDSNKTLAVINRIALDIDFISFMRGKPFLKALDLLDARLSLPIDPSVRSSPNLVLSHLSAHLLLPPNQIYLSQAEAQMYGFHVTASGRLINPGAYHPASPSGTAGGTAGKPGKQGGWLPELTDQLNALRFEGEPPRIEIQFSGDLAEPGKIFAQATLWAEKVRRNRYRLESVYAAIEYRDRVCALKQFVASDAHGRLDASGTVRMPSGEAELFLKSTLDLQGAAGMVQTSNPLGEFVFYEPPTVALTANGNIRDLLKSRFSGRVALQKFGVRSVIFQSLGANFSWNAGQWYADDFTLAHRSGEVVATAMRTRDEFRCKLQSSINPRDLLPLLSGKAAETLAELEFEQSPQFTLDIRGPAPDFDRCEATGGMKLGRTRIRGVPLNSATARLNIRDQAVTYEQFKVTRDEGIATGTFAYDFGRHEVRLDRVKTSIFTADAAVWIDRKLARDIAPYKFKTPPNVALNGVVGLGGGSNTHLEVLVDSPGGMDYVFLKKTLSAQKITGRLLFTEGKLRISDLDAHLFSGRVTGGADISLKRGEPGHSAKIQVENIDFPALTKLYFNYDTSQGVLDGNYEFTGRGDDARTMQGRGSLTVVKGDVFAIPVFGPFSGILNGIVPGMGYNVARQASATFEVRNGVLSTDDFSVKGQGFEMVGSGKISFLDDKINFNIRINASGLPGVLLFPVSKLFEYTSDGSLSKPVWHSARLPAL
jgi:hypothetical protein